MENQERKDFDTSQKLMKIIKGKKELLEKKFEIYNKK
jgi:hypothetical protein